jgi:hypothetical protein
MTFAEAKDQVAKKRNLKNWDVFVTSQNNNPSQFLNITEALEEAGNILEQHAASVREETEPVHYSYPVCEQDVADQIRDVFDERNDLPEQIAKHLFKGFKFEKLTAPGC